MDLLILGIFLLEQFPERFIFLLKSFNFILKVLVEMRMPHNFLLDLGMRQPLIQSSTDSSFQILPQLANLPILPHINHLLLLLFLGVSQNGLNIPNCTDYRL